jgi:hypothetical protein
MSFYLTHHNFSPAKLIFATSVSATPQQPTPHHGERSLILAAVCLFLLQAPDQSRVLCKSMKIKDKLLT